MKNIIFLLLSIFFFFKSSKGQEEETEEEPFVPSICYPTPDGLAYSTNKTKYNEPGQDCRNLAFPPQLAVLNRTFKCCELVMKKKSGKGPDFNGCIAVMASYIDDDRYEDIIDYFERGKQYKLQNYFVMLGLRTYRSFNNTYLPMVNGTKYDVQKLYCFSQNNWINIFLILAILFFIY